MEQKQPNQKQPKQSQPKQRQPSKRRIAWMSFPATDEIDRELTMLQSHRVIRSGGVKISKASLIAELLHAAIMRELSGFRQANPDSANPDSGIPDTINPDNGIPG